jgi:hypothetical protein
MAFSHRSEYDTVPMEGIDNGAICDVIPAASNEKHHYTALGLELTETEPHEGSVRQTENIVALDSSTNTSRRGNLNRTRWGSHWQAPVVMVFTLLLGIVLAAGHHTFYTWLNGQAVGLYGTYIPSVISCSYVNGLKYWKRICYQCCALFQDIRRRRIHSIPMENLDPSVTESQNRQ